DQRTDIFSLGVVMYEMAASRLPFTGATSMDTIVSILEKEPPPLDLTWPEAPAEFQRIVSKALRKDREERYQTIKDLLIDLKSLKDELFLQKLERSKAPHSSKPYGEAATDQNVVAAATTDDSPQTKTNRTRRAVTIALAVVVLAGLALGGLVLWRRGAPGPGGSRSDSDIQRDVSDHDGQ